MEKHRTLDCFGVQCPMPIIKTAMEIKLMQVGEILEIIATDAGVRSDMPAWCKKTGHEFMGIECEDDEYRVYVRKQGK